jgi:hypothetical protein
MHKKGPRAIPDFSRHAPPKPGAHGPAPEGKREAPPPTPRQTVKPQATKSKSGGRRGG